MIARARCGGEGAMRRSTDRIITTHTGSLPRPAAIVAALQAKDGREPYDAAVLAASVRQSVFDVVRKQAATGIDVVSDGEHSKSSFTAYLGARLSGLQRIDTPYAAYKPTRDYLAFSAVYDENKVMLAARPTAVRKPAAGMRWIVCAGPVEYVGATEVQSDTDTLRAAMRGVTAEEGFLTALSPSNLEVFYRNDYYTTPDDYLTALADAMHVEYKAIVDAGFVLQIDDPQLVTFYDRSPGISMAECRKYMAQRVEVLNHALRGIAEDRVRFHTCYSTNIAPRVHDLELKHYLDLMLKIKAAAYSFEASNPRHEHEWAVWEEVKLPAGKVLLPGVVSHCVSLVEHPELVAQRIVRYANIVGRENVIASTDCGFGTSAAGDDVHPDVAWAKLGALVEGARLATRQLWGRA
jgi:5-methyltetrahydropteroyltriglutamate--homocysteine methyltransferase